MADIVLITGLSGAGRSGVADVMEDLGWFVVDNLPTALIGTIVELAAKPNSDIERLALVAGRQHVEVLSKVGELRAAGHDVRVLFLDASTAELVRRYDATRRLHPLAEHAEGLVESIELERAIARPPARCRRSRDRHDRPQRAPTQGAGRPCVRFVTRFATPGRRRELRLQARSAARRRHRDGRPLPAEPALGGRPAAAHRPRPQGSRLRAGDGRPARVSSSGSTTCSRRCCPQYEAEGRSYLTVAIGCTGGRHRSVAVAEELAERLRGRGDRRADEPPRRRPLTSTLGSFGVGSGTNRGYFGRSCTRQLQSGALHISRPQRPPLDSPTQRNNT